MKRSQSETKAIEGFADRMSALMPRLMRGMMGVERNDLARGLITIPQFWLLDVLSHTGPLPMGSLAREMRLGPSTLTGLVDRLVRRRLVRRLRGARDRRTVRVARTAAGRRVVEELYAEKRRMAVRLFACVPVGDRDVYLRVLERLVESLEQTPAEGMS